MRERRGVAQVSQPSLLVGPVDREQCPARRAVLIARRVATGESLADLGQERR